MPLLKTIAACLLAFSIIPTVTAWANPELRRDAREFWALSGSARGKIEAAAGNSALVALGQSLFHDDRLGPGDGRTCASCHDLAKGGSNGARTEIGHTWQKRPRNVPSIFNAALNEESATDPPENDAVAPRKIRGGIDIEEFPSDTLDLLNAEADLRARFSLALAVPDATISPEFVAVALEAYLASLVRLTSPFDRFMDGDDTALTVAQQIGMAAFIDKGCVVCHAGPNLGGKGYEAFAVPESTASQSRMAAPRDRTRISPLRNVSLTAPYFSDGSVASLEEAVALMAQVQLGAAGFDGDVKAISDFLRSLEARP